MILRRLAVLLCGLSLLSGCVNLANKVAVSPLPPGPAVASGAPAVRIGSVSDVRVFEAEPSDPAIPSVGSGNIADAAMKAAAFGRKRNGFGAASAVVVLPEGQTVADLVSSAIESGLAGGGFRVLHKGDAGYEAATPVDIRIDGFWCWVSFGGVGASHNDFRVLLTSPRPEFHGMLDIRGDASVDGWTGNWQEVASRGLHSLSDNLAATLNHK